MVSVGMSKLGCTHLIFVDPGVKINGCYYRKVLLNQQLLPAIRQVSGDFFKLLQREMPAFTSPDLWPPNSPDLTQPSRLQDLGTDAKSYTREKVKDVNELRERLVEVWAGLQQNVIDDAIDQWRRRLHACVQARGGHFEYLL